MLCKLCALGDRSEELRKVVTEIRALFGQASDLVLPIGSVTVGSNGDVDNSTCYQFQTDERNVVK